MSQLTDSATASTVFRPNGLALMAGLFFLGTGLGAVVTLVLQALGYTLPGVISWTYLQLVCIIYVWAMLCTPVCLWVLTVRMDRDGIEGRTFWGRKRRVDFGDMTRVRVRGLGRLGFWVVQDDTSEAPLWISCAVRNASTLEALLLNNPYTD